MTTQSKALIVVALAAVLVGVIIVVGTVTVWPGIAGTDMYFLTTRYDPNGDPNYQAYRTYDNLYRLTQHIAEQHNDFALRFFCTLGLSFVGVGAILVAWATDRERLRRRVRDPGHGDAS